MRCPKRIFKVPIAIATRYLWHTWFTECTKMHIGNWKLLQSLIGEKRKKNIKSSWISHFPFDAFLHRFECNLILIPLFVLLVISHISVHRNSAFRSWKIRNFVQPYYIKAQQNCRKNVSSLELMFPFFRCIERSGIWVRHRSSSRQWLFISNSDRFWCPKPV